MKTTKPPCSKSVFQGYKSYPCSRKGSVERDGQWYCKQHDPATKKAREDASYAKYQAESAKRADYHHRAVMFAELLEALKLMMVEVGANGLWMKPGWEGACSATAKAIAKAEGREP